MLLYLNFQNKKLKPSWLIIIGLGVGIAGGSKYLT